MTGDCRYPDVRPFPDQPQGNDGPPQVSLTPTGGGLGAARPWGRSGSVAHLRLQPVLLTHLSDQGDLRLQVIDVLFRVVKDFQQHVA